MLELRAYQADALASIKKCLKESADPVLVDSSVGSGKSLILSELLLSVERAGYRGLCLTMNSTLIDQNNTTYQNQGGKSGIYCSGLKGKDTVSPIIFASPHSIAIGIKSNKKIKEVPFNIIVVDECFVEGTLIDGIKIEKIKPNDVIQSFNHSKNCIEKKKVLNIQKRKSPDKFYCINSCYGVIITTENHPFYVLNKGYVAAKFLQENDLFYDNRSNMQHLQSNNIQCKSVSKMEIKKNWIDLSYRWLWMEFANKKERIIRKIKNKKPNGHAWCKRKNGINFEVNRTQTTHARWQWTAIINASVKFIKSTWGELVSRACGENKIKTKRWLSSSLQNRYCQPYIDDSCRSGRPISWCFKTKNQRHKKNQAIGITRLESIKIYEQSSIAKLYPNIKFDYVYNLEVEDNNNYFANNILVHNCHNIDHTNNDSLYMRILNHYGFQAQQEQRRFRIVGLSGTCYRGNAIPICGENEFFKTKACSITASYLIEHGYLTKPIFKYDLKQSIDFSKLKTNSFGKFNHNELEEVINKNERLTGEIMRHVIHVINNGRNLAFIFASTIRHCEECMRSLPKDLSACITGKTPHEERKRILNDARSGKIKYLVNVQTLLVGIDCTIADVACFVRPTESLVLFVQAIGRVLRLHEGKKDALIIDAAGNLDRFQDWDDPIINEALQARGSDDEEEKPFICYRCQTYNSLHCRRCVGMVDGKRCDYYFQFKSCPRCLVQNDTTSKYCRSCHAELIDPNAKLTREKKVQYELIITQARYWLTLHQGTGTPILNAEYKCVGGVVYESYFTNTSKNANIFYAKFLRIHLEKASDYYIGISNYEKLKTMLESGKVKTPRALICTKNEYNRSQIVKKLFIGDQMSFGSCD